VLVLEPRVLDAIGLHLEQPGEPLRGFRGGELRLGDPVHRVRAAPILKEGAGSEFFKDHKVLRCSADDHWAKRVGGARPPSGNFPPIARVISIFKLVLT
jgi:hypothetical protein